MPIERAVPRTVRMAASMSVQFMSCIFCAASSRTCFSVTLPTLFLFGSFEPAPGFLPVGEAGGLLEEHADGRRLQDEGEGAVGVDRDHHGDDHVPARGLGVELLAEAHDVDAVLTERGADGRRRVRLAGGELQLDVTGDLSSPWLFSCSYGESAQ